MIDRRHLLAAGAALGLIPAGARAAPSLGPDNPVVDAFVKTQAFQGVVLLGRQGTPTYARAFDYADIEAGRPATLDTAFGVASISKWLTTITVLRLVERGALDLDAPITTWLPAYRADTGAKVTLRRLLSNSSGVPNLFNAAAKADPTLMSRDVSTAEGLKLFCQGDLIFEPGARFDYALTNWMIVLAVVEAATGRPFREAMRAITLDPLGLRATEAGAEIAAAPATAASYRTVEPPVRWVSPRFSIMAAGGGYYSTAADLLRAAHLVFDTGFLAPASLRRLTTIEVASDSYALGGRVRTLTIAGQAHTAGWETGNTAGFRSLLGHRLDTGETVVILNNTAISQKTLDLFADALFGAVTPA